MVCETITLMTFIFIARRISQNANEGNTNMLENTQLTMKIALASLVGGIFLVMVQAYNLSVAKRFLA